MGKRSRLFASAAFPLLSLSLAFEPAAAAALREQPVAPLTNDIVGVVAGGANASIEVAQQAAPAAQPDEEQLKHKKPGEGGQGEPQGQKHEGGAEQKPPKQQPEAQPPKAEHQQPAQQEQPKAEHKQPAEAPQAQPEAKPQPKAAAPEPAPATQQQKQNAQQPAKQPEAKQPEAAPQPKAEHKQPAAEQPQGQPAPKAQQPAPAQKVAPAAGEPQNQQAQPEKQVQPEQKAPPKQQIQSEAPAQQPAEQPLVPAGQPPKGHKTQPGTQVQPETQPGTQVVPGAEQGQKPAGDKTHGKQPQNQQQGEQPAANPQQPAQKTEPQGQQGQEQNQAAPQPGKQQPNKAAETPAQGTATPAPANGSATPAPANGNAAPAPANGSAQQGAEIQLPPAEQISPQDLERRKKIAEDPASAKGPVILPVQNGSAVLDSQKDAVRRGEHLNSGQNPGAPGAQGQKGQGQNGQAQNAPAQQPPPAYTKPPTSDAEAQRAAPGGQPQPPVKMEAVTSEQGRRIDRRPDFASPQGTAVQTIINQDNRTIVNVDNNYVVRHDDTDRFVRGGERPTYEQLPRDRYRETIDQPDGDRVITIRNRYGDIIQRSRIDASGREYVLFYSPELEQQPDHDNYFRDPGDDLPPMRLLIPLSQYIIDTASNRNADYYDFLREPPVEPVERIYSVNEVRYSARIRDKIRRIDLDTITFATGSADIPMSQASSLRGVADGISQIVKRDPTETFLIEGHTDAVGSAESNLILSDRRAESVANVLSDVYGIPAENLVTQGYGEQYLKVNTLGPSQENRRVTIRRITPLVRPVASNR
ncbi:OmpA family protein [Rhizobium sp. SG570]|uniref:OmpA family protein n=1 Tax=Rhizobium sp. SG570 TaxID=2587113 RepID=UPI0014462C99|nr:OmpA family protein [Rhizobium sp. SG570]NKJ37898.1 outer membrane protein OmpA-like peptidoglycan-associated protein [Rhizobium sp. SG570]